MSAAGIPRESFSFPRQNDRSSSPPRFLPPLTGGEPREPLAQRGVSILIDNSNGHAQSVITRMANELWPRVYIGQEEADKPEEDRFSLSPSRPATTLTASPVSPAAFRNTVTCESCRKLTDCNSASRYNGYSSPIDRDRSMMQARKEWFD